MRRPAGTAGSPFAISEPIPPILECLELHRLVTQQAGGAAGVRDLGALESAVAQPRAGFGGADLYPSLAEKRAALCYSLALNHPLSTAISARPTRRRCRR